MAGIKQPKQWRRATRRARPVRWPMLLAGAAGAALAYFLDPDLGRRRRHLARDRLAASGRRGARRAAGRLRGLVTGTAGLAQRGASALLGKETTPDDVTLARKVESRIFRSPEVPKGRINVNVEHGVVVVRGEVDHPEQISAVEAAVRRVPGVADVENLLHLPGAPAPRRRPALATD